MELGSGTGFVGMVAAKTAHRVFVTDYAPHILENCLRNARANAHLFRYGDEAIKVRCLDWTQDKSCPLEPDYDFKITSSIPQEFQWQQEDQNELQQVRILLAADGVNTHPSNIDSFSHL